MANKKEKRIDYNYNFKVYLGFVLKHKWLLGILATLMIFRSALNFIAKFLVKLFTDAFTFWIDGQLTYEELLAQITLFVLIYVGIYVARILRVWWHTEVMNRLYEATGLQVKQWFFRHILFLSEEFHTNKKTGAIIGQIRRGSSQVSSLTNMFMTTVLPILLDITIAVVSIFVVSKISGLIALLMVFIYLGYALLINKMKERAQMIMLSTMDRESAQMTDMLTSYQIIKYLGREEFSANKYAALSEQTRKDVLKHTRYYNWLASGKTLIVGVGLFLTLYLPLQMLLREEITLGTFLFLYTLYFSISGPLDGLERSIRSFYSAMGAFETLFPYKKIEQSVKNKAHAKKASVKRGTIEFDHVSFSYQKKQVVKDFNLAIAAGKKVAIVGASGSGKSTMTKLLFRLYDVSEGSVRIDGVDVRDYIQESLRSELSIVPQEGILFDDTIYNNIKFANPKATRTQVMRAIKLAKVDKIIAELPNKEQTVVGERGVKLSGGEKQRVSIARALLADKKILVLDEATSALDSETEYEIQQALQTLLKGRTSVIIAHRLSTIMQSDLIVVMDKGKIVQQGTHAQLVRRQGKYRKLWDLQKGGYIK